MATRYDQKTKDEVVAYIQQYNEEKGRGGQSAAVNKWKLNPITVKSWLEKAGVETPGKGGKKKRKAGRPAKAASAKAPKAPRAVKAAKAPRAAKAEIGSIAANHLQLMSALLQPPHEIGYSSAISPKLLRGIEVGDHQDAHG